MSSTPNRVPGVYIEEVSSGARPIQAAGTSTVGFVGIAPNATLRVMEVVPVDNWTDFVQKFASPSVEEVNRAKADQKAVDDLRRQNPDGKTLDEARAKFAESSKFLRPCYPELYKPTNLAQAIYGFFLNGGTRCYVVNLGTGDEVSTVSDALTLFEKIDELSIIVAPGFTDNATYTAIREHCENLADRVGILDGPAVLTDQAMKQLSGEAVDNPPWEMPAFSTHGQICMYVPWLEVVNPESDAADKTVIVPPSGHIAGVWVHTDATRGVHKAPANESVQGAVALQRDITHTEQGEINANSVNCIRNFDSEGILVWGARTLTSDSDWQYLNVRRLFNMLQESITKGTRWAVFEPSDRALWQSIRRDVGAFFTEFWRNGALMGSTPEEAFFVKCDEENNPIDIIGKGQLVIDIGIAPVRPAEFMIFRVIQYEAGA